MVPVHFIGFVLPSPKSKSTIVFNQPALSVRSALDFCNRQRVFKGLKASSSATVCRSSDDGPESFNFISLEELNPPATSLHHQSSLTLKTTGQAKNNSDQNDLGRPSF
jgi:hypothetical protein